MVSVCSADVQSDSCLFSSGVHISQRQAAYWKCSPSASSRLCCSVSLAAQPLPLQQPLQAIHSQYPPLSFLPWALCMWMSAKQELNAALELLAYL